MDTGRPLLSFIKSSLPKMRDPEPLLERLQGLGVEDLEDLSYLQESDLLSVLRPIEARKLLSLLKKTIDYSSETASSPRSTSSSSMDITPRRLSDNSWHFKFQIPWQKIPSEIIRKLEKGNRPTKSERLEIIRLIVSEILTACPTPGKKHISEIARKMTKAYPGAFTDVIEGEIVGSGYDSITKQMVSRVDNLKRGNTLLSLKRQVISSSEGEDSPTQKRRLDTYGCINWQPTRLPPDETPESQKHAQEELKKMWTERCCDSKAIENMMRATFFTQRKDIISGTETSDLTKEWPYLFETTGMKTHFKELIGVDMEDKNMANKCARVISFLKSGDKTGKMETIFREMETSSKNVADVNVAVFLPLLLKYFNEEEEQMFYKVDQTTLPSEVDCAGLPRNSTLAAENFMLSVDQTIVNGHIRIFSDAVMLMFGSYYCMNISYPAAQASTLEFLQRCLFKINPDKGSKVERNATKRTLAVSPKVLTLITRIADYEWRE
ncbi:hypothetical protein N1851_012093 [Merluccius polli]|uniref:Uncharacterized protein n=1 Tax=Merluccius polli TaxID=89951 RepID=A0AA47P2K0_MERPO|nr:hypothetical protein N1851_013078 [Merluccius polli]KAK0148186.1 hypothetical protein N1851_012093 [Merluccius polli]